MHRRNYIMIQSSFQQDIAKKKKIKINKNYLKLDLLEEAR